MRSKPPFWTPYTLSSQSIPTFENKTLVNSVHPDNSFWYYIGNADRGYQHTLWSWVPLSIVNNPIQCYQHSTLLLYFQTILLKLLSTIVIMFTVCFILANCQNGSVNLLFIPWKSKMVIHPDNYQSHHHMTELYNDNLCSVILMNQNPLLRS